MCQYYTLESNKMGGSKDCVVYQTKGIPVQVQAVPAHGGGQNGHDILGQGLGDNTVQLDPYQGVPVETAPTNSKTRVSELRCWICHEKLGTDYSKRIGIITTPNQTFNLYVLVCTKVNCYRGAMHMYCSNFTFPPTMLSKIRCYYKCREHRRQEASINFTHSLHNQF